MNFNSICVVWKKPKQNEDVNLTNDMLRSRLTSFRAPLFSGCLTTNKRRTEFNSVFSWKLSIPLESCQMTFYITFVLSCHRQLPPKKSLLKLSSFSSETKSFIKSFSGSNNKYKQARCKVLCCFIVDQNFPHPSSCYSHGTIPQESSSLFYSRSDSDSLKSSNAALNFHLGIALSVSFTKNFFPLLTKCCHERAKQKTFLCFARRQHIPMRVKLFSGSMSE